jgi:Fe-S cluster assembly iron-binding protein IscA
VKFYLTTEVEEALEGVEIDYIKSEQGEGFVINNPTAKGCGPSCGGCG